MRTESEKLQFVKDLKAFVIATGITISIAFNRIYHQLDYFIEGALITLDVKKKYYQDIKQTIYLKLVDRLKRIDYANIINIDYYLFIMIKRLVINELDKYNKVDKVTDSYPVNEYFDLIVDSDTIRI